jgi:molybdopterin converting factor small subunit
MYSDPDFASQVEAAREVARDELREIIRKRAVDGIVVQTLVKGQLVDVHQPPSDRILELHARIVLPEARTDRGAQVAVQVNNNTTHVPPSAPLSPADQVAFLKDYTSRLERQIGGDGS